MTTFDGSSRCKVLIKISRLVDFGRGALHRSFEMFLSLCIKDIWLD